MLVQGNITPYYDEVIPGFHTAEIVGKFTLLGG